jgi:hypothetical protein
MKLSLSISTIRFLLGRCQGDSHKVRLLLANYDDVALLYKHVIKLATSKDLDTDEDEISSLLGIAAQLKAHNGTHRLMEEYIAEGGSWKLLVLRNIPLTGVILFNLEDETYALNIMFGEYRYKKGFVTLSRAYIEWLKIMHSRTINHDTLTMFHGYKALPKYGALKGHVTMSDDFDEPLEDMEEYTT